MAVVGARPGIAVCLRDLPAEPADAAETAAQQLEFGSNLRAGEEYRRRICQVLVCRALLACKEEDC